MAICLGHARTSRGLVPYPTRFPVPTLHIRVLGAAAVNAACGVWGDYRFRLPNSAFFLAFPAAAESRHADQMDMPKRSMRCSEARRISSSVRPRGHTTSSAIAKSDFSLGYIPALTNSD